MLLLLLLEVVVATGTVFLIYPVALTLMVNSYVGGGGGVYE